MDSYQNIDILLVEDNDADAELTLRALRKSHVANKIARVRDGVEALEFVFREGPFAQRDPTLPKLIMLDMQMPRLNGLEVLRRLKADNTTKMIPIVMLTSSAMDRDLLQSYELGVNSYLVKPVDVAAFIDLVLKAGLYWVTINRTPPNGPA
jgi:two-component system, response regulator